jgi:L-lactate dehydrogenase
MSEFEKIKKALFQQINTTPKSDAKGKPKITVVGVGQVGMASASSILQKGIVREIALVDVVEDKLKGEMMDLQHGHALVKPVTIKADTDYAVTANSDIVVITAGVRQKEGESRLDLVERNVEVFKKIVPQIVKHSPNATLLVVSNPVDILTWVVWKLSGFPPHKVIGSGTTLDSSRFRFMIAEKLNVAPTSVHAHFIGEHGDSSVPAWSAVTVGGAFLRSIDPTLGTNDDAWAKLVAEVKQSAYEVIKLKGYTSWAIGVCVSVLCAAILGDSEQVYPVSTYVKGLHGIKDEVFISLPCVLTVEGVRDVVLQNLDKTEVEQLQKSAKGLHEIQAKLKL